MRDCVLHIGTHKTGTTSLQAFSSRHRDALAQDGFVYARTGGPPDGPDGHHNLAWEITGDHRYQPAFGTIDDLIAEIAEQPRHVILSSEDFVCSVHRPESFSRFVDRLHASGFAPRIVVYLRNQADYGESLYLELLKFGLTDPFDRFISEIAAERSYRWRDWVFPFCYDDLLKRIEALPGVEVVVRSYDEPEGPSLVADWLLTLGLRPDGYRTDPHARLNPRLDAGTSAELFHRNQAGRPLQASEQRLVAARFAAPGAPRPRMSVEARTSFLDHFRASNDAVAERYPHVRAGLIERPQPRAGDVPPRMEAVFSAEMHDAMTAMTALVRQDQEAHETALLELARERDALAARYAQLRASHEALLASRRWRITQPLAYVGALFRRSGPHDR